MSLPLNYLPCTILRLRILGKFLSFIESLPYYKILLTQTAHDTVKDVIESRSKDKPSLDLKKIIRCALENQSLVITLPWIIEYCSMLDPISVKMRYIQEIYKELIRIYKFVLVPQKNLPTQLPEIEEEKSQEFFSPLKKVQMRINVAEPLITESNAFFLCIHLGWLFDNPLFPRELFIEEPDVNLVDIYVNSTKSTSGLDGTKSLKVNLLYNCCPYLSELKVILCQFHTGCKGTNRKQSTIYTPNRLNKMVAAKKSTPLIGNF